MMHRILVVLGLCFVVLGCGRKPEVTEEAVPVVEGPSVMDVLYENVMGSLRAGDTNAAIDTLSAALEDDQYLAGRSAVTRDLLGLLLRAGRVEDARERVLAALDAGDTASIEGGFGQVYQHYGASGDSTNVLAWTGALMARDLPAVQKRAVYAWRMRALYDDGQVAVAVALIPDSVSTLSEQDALACVGPFTQYVLKSADHDSVAEILDALTSASEGKPALISYAMGARIGLLLAQAKPGEAEAAFRANAAAMTDQDVSRAYQQIQGALKDADMAARKDALALYVLEKLADKPRVRQAAAREWVKAAADRKEYALIPVRLTALLTQNVEAGQVARIYSGQFYDVLNGQDAAVIGRMIELGDTLTAKIDQESVRDAIRALQLDGSFINEDYAGAAKYIEQGLPGRDEAWHEMALNKVKAHQALQENHVEEAITRFRTFMDHVAGREKTEVDPSSGMRYTREMTLGQNAMRIGDLYKKIDKAEDADRAYQEAADYLTRALGAFEDDSQEYALIKTELAKLPKRPSDK